MRGITAKRGARLLTFVVLLSILPATIARAEQSVKLSVTLTPETLGAGTTIGFGFRIATDGHVPPPLTAVDLSYPANIGLITSGLGLATCDPAPLEALGPEGCPRNSLMGYGNALVEIPAGPEIIQETGRITIWMAPIRDGHLALLFYAEGNEPVSAQLIFTTLVLEAPPPFGGLLETSIPVIPSLPESPDAAVIQLRATIGPMHITYYQHAHGRTIAYQPAGLRLPSVCPRGGFAFAATFAFLDGSHSNAHATVPCPGHR